MGPRALPASPTVALAAQTDPVGRTAQPTAAGDSPAIRMDSAPVKLPVSSRVGQQVVPPAEGEAGLVEAAAEVWGLPPAAAEEATVVVAVDWTPPAAAEECGSFYAPGSSLILDGNAVNPSAGDGLITFTLVSAAAPEPSSSALLALGAGLLIYWRRVRSQPSHRGNSAISGAK
jgi:hypothetical protein